MREVLGWVEAVHRGTDRKEAAHKEAARTLAAHTEETGEPRILVLRIAEEVVEEHPTDLVAGHHIPAEEQENLHNRHETVEEERCIHLGEDLVDSRYQMSHRKGLSHNCKNGCRPAQVWWRGNP